MSARPDLWEPRRSNPRGHPVEFADETDAELSGVELTGEVTAGVELTGANCVDADILDIHVVKGKTEKTSV